MTTIQARRGTAAAWTSANSVLAAGETGLETDTGLTKVGDGTTAWTTLGYSVPKNLTSTSVASGTPASGDTALGLVSGVLKRFAARLYQDTWLGGLTGEVARRLSAHLADTAPSPRSWGAVGDGTSHPLSEWLSGGARNRGFANLAAIQAAYPNVPITSTSDEIDWVAITQCLVALDDGTQIVGEVDLGAAHYVVNKAVVVGDGTKYVALHLRGIPWGGGTGTAVPLTMIEQTSTSQNGITYKAPLDKSQSFSMDGVVVKLPSASTAIGIDLSGGAACVGVEIRRFQVIYGATGIKWKDNVNNILDTGMLYYQNVGLDITGGYSNVNKITNITFQANITAGVRFKTYGDTCEVDSCVFQSDTGSAVLLDTFTNEHQGIFFNNCHFEGQFANGLVKVYKAIVKNMTLVNCITEGACDQFVVDGVGDGLGVISQLVSINNVYSALGTAKMTRALAGDPSGSSSPRIRSVQFHGGEILGTTPQFHGLSTASLDSDAYSMFVGVRGFYRGLIPYNTPMDDRPAYACFDNAAKTVQTSGSATLSGGTVTVTLPGPFMSSRYVVYVEPNVAETFRVTSKGNTSFVITSSNAASTATVKWLLFI